MYNQLFSPLKTRFKNMFLVHVHMKKKKSYIFETEKE